MAKTPTPEEAIERARRVQDDRINAIRALAEARQGVEEARAEGARRLADLEREIAAATSTAEREDVKKYNAALAAGWTPDELKKIGYAEPAKTKRARRSSGKKQAAKPAAAASPAADSSEAEPTDEHAVDGAA